MQDDFMMSGHDMIYSLIDRMNEICGAKKKQYLMIRLDFKVKQHPIK